MDLATDSPAERASILLVDDTPANLASLRAILGDLGHELVEARSCEEALKRAKSQEFAAVLIGMRRPGRDGFDTAEAIRADERSRTTPIIFVTDDHIDRAEIEMGYALGAIDYLVRPLSPLVVRAKVRGLVTLSQEKQRARHETEQLRLLVHGTIDHAIFLLDPQGHVVTWNTGAERLKGYRADEIIGRHFSRFYPQEAIERVWPDHELEVAAAEGRFEDEGWRLRKDGSRFWANVVITALRDHQNHLVGFSKVTRDLTARKQAEESLRRSEERFRLLVEGAKDYAIFMLDPEGHVASWNAGAERIKGYSAQEIIGQHFSRFYPQEAIERGWPDHELEVAAAEGRFEDEGWRVRRDGSQFWANVVITALKDERGDLLGFSKITRDMTERKRAEEDARRLVEEAAARRVAERDAWLIREQRERLHVTLASIGDAVISTDVQGRVEFLNLVAEELLGWTTEEAAGRTLGDVFHIVNEGTRQPVENPALRALSDGRIVGLANRTVLISRDGTERPIDDSAAPIRDAEGTVIGSVLVFRDISEQRRAEQHRNARLAVTQALSRAASVDDGVGGVLEAVCGKLGWELGLFWAVNEGGDALVCRTSWHGPDDLLAEFGTASCRRTFARGEGLPGRVWATGKPAWIPDVRHDTNFPRAAAARGDLRSGFAYPVVVGGQTLGVIEFFSRRIREADAELLETMETVAGNVGQFVERKAAEEELRRSERELSDFFENATIGLHWVGPDGTILRANRTELDMLGYSREEYVGRRIADFHVDADVICDILRRLQAGESLTEYPARLRCKDGSIKDVLIDSSVMWRDGHFAHTRCFTRDVTERKRAEEANVRLMAASEQQRRIYETALSNSPDFNYIFDLEGRFAYVNATLLDLWQKRLDEAVGRDFFDLGYPPELAAHLQRQIRQVIETRQSVRDETPYTSHLGERQYEYIFVPVLGSGGAVEAVVGSTRDVTERRRQEEALRTAKEEAEAANQAKTQFLAMLSHELRTPLNPILLAASSMLERPPEPGEIRPTLEMIRQNVHLQTRLIDDLLDVMRIVRGKMPLHWEVADGHKLIDQAVEVCRSEVLSKRLHLEADLAAARRHVNADPARLQQVFWNLIKNAVKFTPEGGSITVRTCNEAGDEGDRIVVEVRDTGIGIEPEVLPYIFDPFQQGETTTTRKFGGLGLGLAICKGIVEAHGGTIVAESGGSCRGTTFRVALKALPEPADDAGAELVAGPVDAETARPTALRILVVEDEPATLRLMARLLRGLGHEVETAGTIASALEVVEAGRFDLIISDIGLPDGSGLELMRRAVARRGAVPAIALTGYGMEEDIRRSRGAGFTAHLTKPIDFAKLEAMIRQVVK